MKFEKKGMLAPFTILTSIVTGVGFPLLGSLAAIDLNVIDAIYYEGIILVLIGGFMAQWVYAHTIHDIYHIDLEKRKTFYPGLCVCRIDFYRGFHLDKRIEQNPGHPRIVGHCFF